MTVEPRVEDLLATIRKAIDDDLGSVGSSASNRQGTLMLGALREMRVNFDGDAVARESADTEIGKLRERIGRSRIESSFAAPQIAQSTTAAVPLRQTQNGFSSILAAPMPQPTPQLRQTLTEDDTLQPQRKSYAQPFQEQVWEQPEPYAEVVAYAESDAQPYYPPEAYGQHAAALVSPQTAYAAQNSFQALSDTIMARATGDRGLEVMTQEMLRGMLKIWLDDNLPSLVERLVREEIERVSRR